MANFRCLVLFLAAGVVAGEVPPLLHHQGRLAVGEVLFEGEGRFKFALVNADASQVFWGNAPDADADGEPDAAVAIPVSRGLYSVLLGDTSLPHMAALTSTVFTHSGLHLRVWFDDGVHGSERLLPDQRLGAVGYAMVAAEVPDGSVTAVKLAPGTFDSLSSQILALTAELHALSNRHEALAGSLAVGLPPGVPLVSPDPEDSSLTALGLAKFMTVPGAAWVTGSAQGSPAPRQGHTAVWTGQAWIVWGGTLGGGLVSGTGASYDAGLDRWSALPDRDGPAARRGHTAVWTGQAMLVWGGVGAGLLGTGAGYDPALPGWSPLPTLAAPAGREGHVAVWTGARMLVWGGRDGTGLRADGGLYDPVDRTWTSLPVADAPAARTGAIAVWTGAEFIVWGGAGGAGELATGGVLPLAGGVTPGAWAGMASAGAPGARTGHSAVWTGERLVIWGGRTGESLLANGAAFDPEGNVWEPVATVGAPSPRSGHVAAWTGTEMLIFGGDAAGGPVATGGAYNPTTRTWRSLPGAGAPVARSGATGAWTGAELLVFGGRANGTPLAALQRLNPQPAWYFYRKP